MGDDSCSRGCGFESRRLYGMDIFHIDLFYKLYCLFEKNEKTKKGPGLAHFFKKKNCFSFNVS